MTEREQPPAVPVELERIWQLALDDAGFHGEAIYLYVTDLSIGADVLAKHLMRCLNVNSELPPEIDAELNGDALVMLDRVLLRRGGRPIEIDAALLRHELEHVRQTRADPELPRLHELTVDVVRHAGTGAGLLYTKIPMERRANAAAGAFARRMFGDARIDALAASTPHPALLTKERAQPSAGTLEHEMIMFLVEHADLCRRYEFFRTAAGERLYGHWCHLVDLAEGET